MTGRQPMSCAARIRAQTALRADRATRGGTGHGQIALLVWLALLLFACETVADAPPPPPVPAASAPPPAVAPTNAPAPTAAPQIVEGGTVVEGVLADAKQFNSILATDAISLRVIALLGNRLINLRPDLTPECDLCESWDISADNLKVTFRLRRGVKFHDGRELTADDVKFTYDSILDPAKSSPFQSPLKNYLPGAAAIKALDSHTVEFTFTKPKGDALVTDFHTPAILPKHILGNLSARDFANAPFNMQKPVYTGPFMLKEWIKGERITLMANPTYFRGKPKLDAYVLRVYPDLTSLFAPLRDGAIDIGTFDVSQLADAQKLPSIHAYAHPALKFTYLSYQLDPAKSRLFQDRRVRQALLYALDRKAIVEKVLFGQGIVAATTVPPQSWAFIPDVPVYGYDPARARALLDEAGWKVGADGVRAREGARFSFTLLTNAGNRIRETAIVEMQRYWNQVGLDVRVQTEEWNAFLKRIGATQDSPRDYAVFVVSFILNADPNQRLLWHSASAANGYNFNAYQNADLDRMLDEALATFDAARRKELYGGMQAWLAEDLPSAPLFFESVTGGYTKRLHNFQPGAVGSLNNVHEWWIEAK